MKKEKVGLREQLREKFKKFDEETFDCFGSNDVKRGVGHNYSPMQLEEDVLAVVDSFLEPSPQTQEIRELLEKRPSPRKGCKLGEVDGWFEVFVPKLEALLADHVSRSKLLETFPKPKLERNQRYKCEIIKNPTAFANLCWRWKKDYLHTKKGDTEK